MAQAPARATPTWPAPRKGARPATRRSQLRRLGIVALLVLVVLLSIVGFTLARLNATATSYPGSHFNQGKNAVWLEHTWVVMSTPARTSTRWPTSSSASRFAMSMRTSDL